jgi:hypothetical protein
MEGAPSSLRVSSRRILRCTASRLGITHLFGLAAAAAGTRPAKASAAGVTTVSMVATTMGSAGASSLGATATAASSCSTFAAASCRTFAWTCSLRAAHPPHHRRL